MRGLEEGWERWVWMGLGVLAAGVGVMLIVWFPSGIAERPLRAVTPLRGEESPPVSAALAESEGIVRLANRLQQLRREGQPRDPFLSSREQDWRSFTQGLSHRPPSLDGILDMEGNLLAMIKGRVHKVGDEVDGFVVGEIRADSVVLLRDGDRVTIRPKSAGGRP